jgi:hypothetical protein
MKKLVLVGLIVVIGLAPAFALAQTRGDETSGQPRQQRGGTTPGSENTPSPRQSTPTESSRNRESSTPGQTRTPDTPSTISTKAECERAGGQWNDRQNKCGR